MLCTEWTLKFLLIQSSLDTSKSSPQANSLPFSVPIFSAPKQSLCPEGNYNFLSHPSSHLHLHQSYQNTSGGSTATRISVVELGFTLRSSDSNPDTSPFLLFSCPWPPSPISSSFHPSPILCYPSPKSSYSDLQLMSYAHWFQVSRQGDSPMPTSPTHTHPRAYLAVVEGQSSGG